ncbi:MAG: magnesium chelatase subunit H [Gammaproteobacteria bacterium]|nr:magnesium chelatase subunit H [Gammaproteobacteria bacterium]
MKPKRTSVADPVEYRVTIVTLDNHLSDAMACVGKRLAREIPGFELSVHAATDWEDNPDGLAACHQAIGRANLVFVSMLFMDDHIRAVLPALQARRDDCDAMVCCMSAPEVVHLTRMGRFSMDGPQSGAMALLKRLRGSNGKSRASAGAQQLSVLRKLPRILRFIPGKAQDLRAYFLALQYWLAGSEENFMRMIRFLVSRYADGPRRALNGAFGEESPILYPDLGVYHPRLKDRITDRSHRLPRARGESRGTIGLLIMRSYVLAGNTAHYDAVIDALEARGLSVITAFATGLDARPAVEKFFVRDGQPIVDAMVSMTGFSLVGGPAYNDAQAAEELLAGLDIPYLSVTPVELQTLNQWEDSTRGLMPVETTMMVAIPELDGATGSMVFAGRRADGGSGDSNRMHPEPERVEQLAARVTRLVELRATPREERRLAIVLFNFPPNAANVGTAAHLDVFGSLYNTLQRLAHEGYDVEVPASLDALRNAILQGNADQHGTPANVCASVAVDDYVRQQPHLDEIEAQWGPAPGRQQTNGKSIYILGAQFGKVFVGVQPGFGYEGDPMRLLFESGFAPTHAFAAFYAYLRDNFGAHSVLHFGTHGALEFMPGKQVGLSGNCWPERLIGDLPNFYLYASNNPSEGIIARRRGGATLITYLTPTVAKAGLYRGLADLKDSIERWRGNGDAGARERAELASLIQAQAAAIDLAEAEPEWQQETDARIEALRLELLELEQSLIPLGLHVVGAQADPAAQIELLAEVYRAASGAEADAELLARIVANPAQEIAIDAEREDFDAWQRVRHLAACLAGDHELEALVSALDGRYVRPAPGGDLLNNPEVVPTGRNMHGFDPFRMPSQFALLDGRQQAEQLLQRHRDEGNGLPETVALVLWGTDNLKSEGAQLSQALALIGARPRLDSYGRVCGAELMPLEELGRPRIDVVLTLSGIFRDLLPLQTRLLAEAAFLAASADEPAEQNYVRKHVLAYQEQHDCDFESATLRVFSNAEGAYGSNVNLMIDNGLWQEEDELAATFTKRKCFAYDHKGRPAQKPEMFEEVLSGVELAYQNLDSVELGITSVDHYFDTLGGITRAIQRSTGDEVPVYISDQTTGDGKVRTLSEQLSLETRSRILNPKWHESILTHGYEGVREIEAHITNTVGWSATTGQVDPRIYTRFSETFVLDKAMRERMSKLNPAASLKLANRLLEAHDRQYWNPDGSTLDALRDAVEELEDSVEGITSEVAA